MNPQVLIVGTCLALLLSMANALPAQNVDLPLSGQLTRQQLDQLRLDDSVLRSEMRSAQSARQVEISQLEGRILQLEEQLRDRSSRSSTSELAYILSLAGSISAVSPAMATEPPSTAPKPESDATAPKQAKPEQATTDMPSADLPSADLPSADLPVDIREMLVQDFVLGLEIELLAARAEVMEKSSEVKSLERLATKGLASAAQLELQQLHRRRAELRVTRYEKQLSGLRRIYADYFRRGLPDQRCELPLR